MAQRPQMDSFTHAYINAALLLSNDEDDNPLDRNYDIRDISTSTLRKMKADCLRFKRRARNDLDESGMTDEDAGYNFWLSRNEHGAGFFDKDLGPVGDRLQSLARRFGQYDLYVGDDGKIYG